MGRLLAPRRQVLARFGEPEHKGIGDQARPDLRWRLPGAKLFKELELTFGDWVALGDWFEDVNAIKRILRNEPERGAQRDTVGQLYYTVIVKIRPANEAAQAEAEKKYMDVLFTKRDKAEVENRYADLKTRNIKHFPNPLVGDTALSTLEKATRRRNGKPFGALAQYRADHIDAINLAISAGQLGEERLAGEALAIDGFACHFLTDAFSGSHARTPRSSIETYWDGKVPGFKERLVNWLADEVTYAVDTDPSGFLEWLGGRLDNAPFHVVRTQARKKVRPVVPDLGFGDLVGLVVHDWDGAHGPNRHGPLVEVSGQRFHLAGDDALLPAVGKLRNVSSDSGLRSVLKDSKRSGAERTFAGATLAVRASVADVERAYELAKKGDKRNEVIKALTGKDGLFAPERLIPKVVPDGRQPEDDRMPKWDYATVEELLASTKIKAARCPNRPNGWPSRSSPHCESSRPRRP
jgi:hypothetical protein